MGFVRAVGASVVLLGTLGTAAFAQAPARVSVVAQKHHRMAVEYFNKAQKDTTLTADQKRDAVLQGIAAEDRALAIDPDYIVALVYKNILLRMRAVEAEQGKEREELISQADALGGRVAVLQAAHPERSFLSIGGAIDQFAKVPADFKALVDSLHPVRADGRIKNPTLMRNTRHEYPPIARAVRIQGLVILEIRSTLMGTSAPRACSARSRCWTRQRWHACASGCSNQAS